MKHHHVLSLGVIVAVMFFFLGAGCQSNKQEEPYVPVLELEGENESDSKKTNSFSDVGDKENKEIEDSGEAIKDEQGEGVDKEAMGGKMFEPDPISAEEIVSTGDTSEWQVFENESCHMRISFPPGYFLAKTGECPPDLPKDEFNKSGATIFLVYNKEGCHSTGPGDPATETQCQQHSISLNTQKSYASPAPPTESATFGGYPATFVYHLFGGDSGQLELHAKKQEGQWYAYRYSFHPDNKGVSDKFMKQVLETVNIQVGL